MAAKNVKKCRYRNCPHNFEIDITADEYEVCGKSYYHKDCFQILKKITEKEEQQKADIQLIKNLWIENIDKTLVYSDLYMVLNELLSRGIESDYLVFTMRYVVDHQMSLNYPGGFRYYVNRKEIQDAYKKRKAKAVIGDHEFKVTSKEDGPKFNIGVKQKGFQSIFQR